HREEPHRPPRIRMTPVAPASGNLPALKLLARRRRRRGYSPASPPPALISMAPGHRRRTQDQIIDRRSKMNASLPAERRLWFLDTLVLVRLSYEDGSDDLSVLEHWSPFGLSPPLHIHSTED